ncbi:MAG: glycosyltransferase family 4 protein [Gammaproteobacteria bacterium]|nr:glycosyltransferase family 4 protein [Gammaproteobacteria bacterium]MBU1481744.1 glycosyltransferase family 4 protein [Gammaproteobacteria bacterium]
MRILIVHNAYQHRGGEDSVVEAEISLLRSRGHDVETYLRSNDDVGGMSSLALARQTLWSSRSWRDMAERIDSFRPDIIHVHNTFPLISPSLYWAADRAGVPVVQTLHNFRLMCLNALFLREGKVCEDCLGRSPWKGVLRKCYRGSGAASSVLAGMLSLHRGLGTYQNQVTRYIALNEFCRSKFIEGGLPAERVVVKPNFVDFAAPQTVSREGMLFVGRLSVEKGISTLIKSLALSPGTRLRVAGDGPESGLLDGVPGVNKLGSLPGEKVREEMSRTLALVVPSIWYENFPRTIVEAFACGLPVIASRIGALADIVRDGETGLLFEPGNPRDLADKMAWAQAHPQAMLEMGKRARQEYEEKYTSERNFGQLMAIYAEAIKAHRSEARQG